MQSKDRSLDNDRIYKRVRNTVGVMFIWLIVMLALLHTALHKTNDVILGYLGFWETLGALISVVICWIAIAYLSIVSLLIAIAVVLSWLWPKGLVTYGKFTALLAKFWPLEVVDKVVIGRRAI